MERSKTSLVVGCINVHLGRIEKRRSLRHLLVDRAQVDICVVAETRFIEGRGVTGG